MLHDTKVTFAKDVIGPSADEAVANIQDGEVVLLENLRFHKEETKNDPEFAKKLASYAVFLSTMPLERRTVHMLPQRV